MTVSYRDIKHTLI